MRTIITIAAIALLASCGDTGPNEKEKASIKLAVEMHNINTSFNYKMQSIRLNTLKETAKLAGYSTSDGLRLLEEELGKYKTYPTFDLKTNRYDTGVTVDKFLAWCKQYDKKPMEWKSFLDVETIK